MSEVLPTAGRQRASRLSAERRGDIFAAVVNRLVADGYDAMTVDQVALDARASKATIYRQWGDKAHLVVAALAAQSGIDISTVDTGTLEGDLEALVAMLAAPAQLNIQVSIALAHVARRDPLLKDALARHMLPELSALRAVVDRAVARQEIAKSSAGNYLPHLLLGALLTPSMVAVDLEPVSLVGLRRFLHAVILPALRHAPADSPVLLPGRKAQRL